ncbi:hypothetical protein RclHR1_00960010 [Rhizophagus clarus]|uniref:Serine/threonine protein kinase n=1 Tax=Rhizophagus clarus TaxID=94130 RepID=A0A2Z6SAV9_9GLOM|nr:hypothetical protein RclHR1_00960010 [Rhizophagus clarus]
MSIIGNNIRDYIKNNSIWTSRNEKIDSFIRGRQSYIDKYEDTVIEWIPYNQFNEVKEICKSDHITLFSAIWKDGPLYKRTEQSKNYVRDSNKKVVLKCLHNNNSQNPFDFLKNEAIKYPLKRKAFLALYGISQNPNTNDYILVQRNYTLISGNEKIDYFIHEMQLRIKVYKDKANEWKYNDTKSEREYEDTVIEWIPYNQFNEIRETGKIGRMMTIYSAIWENGPYRKNKWSDNYTRVTNKEVALNCLHIDDSQDPIDFLINEAKKYSSNHEAFLALYGISQNPNTNDYILVQKNYTLTSGNEKIDCFIYKMQLKINKYEDAVIEWISYNQFDEIKKTGNIGHITVYSAIWKDGPLCKNYKWGENYTRNSDKEVALYCLHINDSQDPIDFLINEAKKYSTKHKAFLTLYGISQNPDTNDYILVQKNHTLTSGNEKIDYFIHERQLKMNKYEDTVIEWIPYEQFNKIKKITKCGHISVYSAIWKDGPLYKMDESSINYTRDSNKKVALKCFHINYSPDPIDYLINEIKKYSTKHEAFLALYGISQDPITNDYILVQKNHTLISGNEKIDDFIHEMQLKIKVYNNNTSNESIYNDTVIEWIPYNQFNEIKKTSKSGHMTTYSAIWKDGPLYKNKWSENFIRDSNKEIALKCLHINDSYDSVDFLINEAKKYSTKHESFLALYGISQDPNTNDYILVLKNHTLTSGNEKIDDFINNRQNEYKDILIEWIPYNQFSEIKEIGKCDHISVYSAIWEDGPLYKVDECNENYYRDPNKKVALKILHINSPDPIDFLINEAKEYSTNRKAFLALYGISQDPSTNDYILVQNNCTLISGNEKIDYFIHKMQLNIRVYYNTAIKRGYDDYDHHTETEPEYEDIVIEWIPYNQFDKIKETGKIGHMTIYSAIWKDGPLYKNKWSENFVRNSNKEIALKCLHINNSQDPVDFLINEAKKYSTIHESFLALYGISQNPNTNDYILVQNNYTLTSGNEKIDYFIHEMQLKVHQYKDMIIEWIPYDQFDEIEEIGNNSHITVYSATWKDGPLRKNNKCDENFTRDSYIKVILKCLHVDNLQDPIDFLISEAKEYSSNHKAFLALYGISQDPNTNDYILVQNNCTLISGNEKIDDFIHEMQLKIKVTSNGSEYNDTVIEWIPYNQLNEIKETNKSGYMIIYSAIWKDGPLYKNKWNGKYLRDSNKEVALKCLHINNSQDPVDFLIKEAKKYSTNRNAFLSLYGISQNPNTDDYILVQNNCTLISGIEKIDYFIHEMQLNMSVYSNASFRREYDDYDYTELEVKYEEDMVIEWIPYNQFNEIKKIGKIDYMTIDSAIWKDGPLYMDRWSKSYIRDPNKKVALKCLHINNNSQDPVDFLINEAKKYSIKRNAFLALHGISQNPNTNDYILIQNTYTLTSGNEKIDYFIHEMQLKVHEYKDVIIEWIPYNQFDEIEEIGKNNHVTLYSAKWEDGPLCKNEWYQNFTRDSYKEVVLRCLHISNIQDPIDFLINEARKYSTKHKGFLTLYGISQDPNTNDYILVQNNYTLISGNEKIDDFIHEMQLKMNEYDDALYKDDYDCDYDYDYDYDYEDTALEWEYGDTIIEWIPYNQFDEIKETGKIGHMTIYSAIWKDGPLCKMYKRSENYTRDSNKEVALNCLHINNSQDPIDFLINEAKKYSTNHNAFLALYGISQNPNTNDYILVQKNYTLTSGNEKIDYLIHEMQLKMCKYEDTVIEWIPYNQFDDIKEIGKNCHITVHSAVWKDGPLYRKKWSENFTRESNIEMVLKCLHISDSQDPIDLLTNEAKKCSTKHKAFLALYGISQNPNTNDYILIQKNYTLLSGNEKIDEFIHAMQLKVDEYNTAFKWGYDDWEYKNTMIEWIAYNRFDGIKKTGKRGHVTTVYSAIWKDGPLKYNYNDYTRNLNKEVTLNSLHINDSQDPIDFLINEAKKYSTRYEAFLTLYGISQNPYTNDYILVQNNYTLTSGNEKIDGFIHEMQLKIDKYEDIVIEWIPYNQFDKITEIEKNGHITIYSAIWKDGPLIKYYYGSDYVRNSNKEVSLKFLHINSQDSINFLISEAKKYSTKHKAFLAMYGISQNPNTNDYILVQNNYILTSGNEKIDDFIYEMQLKMDENEDENTVIEWIPYNHFNEIKEISRSGHITVYSAIWKDGPLYRESKWSENYTRDSNKEVALNCLHINTTQDPVDFLINEAKKYSAKSLLALYGISQNPNTNDYILVQNNTLANGMK